MTSLLSITYIIRVFVYDYFCFCGCITLLYYSDTNMLVEVMIHVYLYFMKQEYEN